METGPGQVICAPLTHVTVACKNAARRRTTAARRGSCGWDVLTRTELPTRPADEPGKHDASCSGRTRDKQTREENDGEGGFNRVMRLAGGVICGSAVGLRSPGVRITAGPRGFPAREHI